MSRVATMSPSPACAADGNSPDLHWVSLAQASLLLGVHPNTCKSVLLASKVRVKSKPGMRTRFALEDIQRIPTC